MVKEVLTRLPSDALALVDDFRFGSDRSDCLQVEEWIHPKTGKEYFIDTNNRLYHIRFNIQVGIWNAETETIDVNVEEWIHPKTGKTYLIDNDDNMLYDAEKEDWVGIWNSEAETIDILPDSEDEDESDDSEDEDESDDSEDEDESES